MQLLKFVSRIQKFANLVHTDKYKKVQIPLSAPKEVTIPVTSFFMLKCG